MTRIIIVLLLTTVSNSLLAQSDAFIKFYDKYAANTSFTQVSVTSKMFSLFTEMEGNDEEEKQLLEVIGKLKGLKILAADSIVNGKKYFTEAATATKSNYEELMSVKNADEDVLFMIRESGGKINELLMMVGGNDKFYIMSLFGEIDLKQISKLSGAMKIKGMEYLDNIDNKGTKN